MRFNFFSGVVALHAVILFLSVSAFAQPNCTSIENKIANRIGKIERLNVRIAKFQSRIERITARLLTKGAKLQQKLDAANAELEAIQLEIEQLDTPECSGNRPCERRLAKLQKKAAKLQNKKIPKLETRLAKLNPETNRKIDRLESRIANTQQDIAALETQLAGLQAELTDCQNPEPSQSPAPSASSSPAPSASSSPAPSASSSPAPSSSAAPSASSAPGASASPSPAASASASPGASASASPAASPSSSPSSSPSASMSPSPSPSPMGTPIAVYSWDSALNPLAIEPGEPAHSLLSDAIAEQYKLEVIDGFAELAVVRVRKFNFANNSYEYQGEYLDLGLADTLATTTGRRFEEALIANAATAAVAGSPGPEFGSPVFNGGVGLHSVPHQQGTGHTVVASSQTCLSLQAIAGGIGATYSCDANPTLLDALRDGIGQNRFYAYHGFLTDVPGGPPFVQESGTYYKIYTLVGETPVVTCEYATEQDVINQNTPGQETCFRNL